MSTEWYQDLKMVITHYIPINHHDPYHIYVGFLGFLLTGIIFRKRYTEAICLLPAFILSIIMELLDFQDDWAHNIKFDWHPYIHGFVVTNIVPVTLFLFIKFRNAKFH